VTYEFMTIGQLECFYAPFYPRWDRKPFRRMIARLGLPESHPVRGLSCGQRSQVVLGLHPPAVRKISTKSKEPTHGNNNSITRTSPRNPLMKSGKTTKRLTFGQSLLRLM
jgi:hypothetical protein